MDRIELEHRLDRNARRFLAAVEYYGGNATTTEIRARTGLTPSETQTRYQVLEDLELITVSYASEGVGNRQPPKIATLTGQARTAIEWGILHNIDVARTPEEIRDLESEVRTIREELAEVRDRQNAENELVKKLQEEVSTLDNHQQWIFQWTEGAEERIIDLLNRDSTEPVDS